MKTSSYAEEVFSFCKLKIGGLSMSEISVVLLGFGTVGQGVYEVIDTHQEHLAALLGKPVKVKGVLIKDKTKERTISSDVLVTDDFNDILALSRIDVVVEAMVGIEPGLGYLKTLIARGSHVITANKELFAHHGEELLALSDENGVSCKFEATVAGGVPVIQTLQQLMKVNRMFKLEGILNGTSNFILTSMRESGLSFEQALAIAQEKGYAEADPTNDVEGYDAFYKLMILSRTVFGSQPGWETVARKGITPVTDEQMEVATRLHLRFKHVASIEQTSDGLKGLVQPILVSKSHPFYHIEGVDNAVSIYSDIVGNITLKGPGAGKLPTASAIMEDLVQLMTQPSINRVQKQTAKVAQESSHESSDGKWLVFLPYSLRGTTLAAEGFHFVEGFDHKVMIARTHEDTVKRVIGMINGASYYAIHGDDEVEVESLARALA